MLFDPNNPVIQLCAQGMQREAAMEPAEAKLLFVRAWEEAASDFEKLVAAHYVGRHQLTVEDKLYWDDLALTLALKHEEEDLKEVLPSLYLNLGKCYEDLGKMQLADENYKKGALFFESLPDNGYGKMIRAAIEAGLRRTVQAGNKFNYREVL